MWDDDQALRTAVLTELDTAPPAAGGGLAEVVRLGRRRRRARHAGTALAVAALLVTTGAVVTVLDGDPLPPAEPVAGEADWPRTDLPTRVPHSVWAGTDRLFSLCDIPENGHDRLDMYPAPAALRADLIAATSAAAPAARVGVLVERHLVPDRAQKREGYDYTADVTDAGGTGSVRLGIGDFSGTPLAAADAQAFDVGNCAPPKRRVLADGTVLQLYEVRPGEPHQSLTQVLRVYLPERELRQVVVQNWGSPDLEPNPGQPQYPNRVGPGRPTLPLTEGQLAAIGLAITG